MQYIKKFVDVGYRVMDKLIAGRIDRVLAGRKEELDKMREEVRRYHHSIFSLKEQVRDIDHSLEDMESKIRSLSTQVDNHKSEFSTELQAEVDKMRTYVQGMKAGFELTNGDDK
jgi:chromosome segregation ATPase